MAYTTCCTSGGGGLVEQQEPGPVHEGLHQPDLLLVSLGELPDGPVQLQLELLGQPAGVPVRAPAPQVVEEGEELAAGEVLVEIELPGADGR